MTVVVIGIGNPDRGDDGAGAAAAALLRACDLPPWVSIVDGDGDPARLLDAWDGAELAVVVDAVHSHTAPVGHVHRLSVRGGSPVQLAPGAPTSHGLGPGDAISLAAALDRLPGAVLVFAIEGDRFELGDTMSAAVSAGVVQVVDEIATLVATHPATLRGAPPCA